MIDADVKVSGLSAGEQATFTELAQQLVAKTPRNGLRRVYYEFKNVIPRLGSIVPPEYYRAGQCLGWSAKSVDLVSRRCNLDGFSWADGDLDSIGASQVWRENDLRQTVTMAMTASLINSVSFLIVTRGQSGEPKALVHAKDALSCTGRWNRRTRSLDAALSITGYDGDGDPSEWTLYLPNLTIPIERSSTGWKAGDRQAHNLGMPVEPLVYRPQIWRPFGTSRISRDVMSAQDAALRTLVRMEGNADVYSFAQMILLGADASDFKNPDGTLKAAWQVALGRIFALPDDQEMLEQGNPLARASVQQFQAQSPQPHIDLYRQQAGRFSGASSIPTIYLGVDDKANPTSADALFIQDLPLIEEAEGATDDWSPAVRRIELKALQAYNSLDAIPAEWQSITPKFHSPAYVSRAAAADAGTKIAAAIPGFADTEVGLEMMGLSPDQVKRFRDEQRRSRGASILRALTEQPPANDAVGG